MSVGAVPLDDEDELPGGPPVPPQPAPVAPPPVAMVQSPIGPVPASTPGLPPPTDSTQGQNPQPGATPQVTPPPIGDSVPASGNASTAPPPPRPTRPPLTGDPAKDIENSLAYERDLETWHADRLDRAAQATGDIRGKAADETLRLQQDEEQRRQAEEAAYQKQLAQQRQDISDHTTARAAAIGDIENGKWRADKSAGGKIVSIVAQALGGLGAGLSAAGGHPTGNLGQQAIDRVMDREYNHMQDRVNNENQAIQQARFGYRDAEDNHRAALNDLDADMAAKYKLVASDAEAQMRARGVAPEQIQQNEIVTGSLQKAAQYEDQIHAREIEAGRKNQIADATIGKDAAQENAANALADYRRGRTHHPGTGGGAGGSAAIDAMNAAAKAGGSVGDLEAAGIKAGMSRKEALAQAKAMLAGHGKGGAAGGGDQSLVVRDVDGTPIGMAPSTRNVKQFEDRFVNYDQAIKSLQGLLAEGTIVPRGSKWDNAVLAIASTTTAGATDTNVAHEAGTLKDAIGTVGSEAIKDKIADLQRRQQQFKRTLRPLPTGFKVDQGDAGAAPKKTQTIAGVTYEFGDDGNWHKAK